LSSVSRSNPSSAYPATRDQLAAIFSAALGRFRRLEFEATLDLCDDILEVSPDEVEALALGGAALLAMERGTEAVERLLKAVRLAPERPDIASDLGLAFLQSQRYEEAETQLRHALNLRPDMPGALVSLGAVLREMGNDDEAVALLNRALSLNPNIAEAHYNLSLIENEGGEPRAALDHAEKALALNPDFGLAMHAKAHALAVLGRPDEALALRRDIAARWPDDARSFSGLALTLMHYGHLNEAADAYRAAIALEPTDGNLHRMLSVVKRHDHLDADIEAMQRLENSNEVSERDRTHLYFGLGKAFEDLREYATAFDYFAKGNRLRRDRLNYSRDESTELFAELKRSFSAEFIAKHRAAGYDDETPVFVLGMPRSGTTLVEQILAAHPEVCAAGEFTLFNRIVDRLRSAGGARRLSERMPLIDDAAITGIGSRYVERLRVYSKSARFITDKLPGNFLMIGLIHLAMPKAKIIHVRRSAEDTCLSIFKNYFANESLRYAYDMAEIGHYYTLYLDLMQHWNTVLPGVVHEVSYEALVGNFDTEAWRLLTTLGLDWNDSVRDFHKASRAVQTASAAQVRQPIYASSVGQAGKVPPELLDTLRTALAG